MNVLLTGATGFIGSHLSRRLEHAGHQVVPVSRAKLPGYLSWAEEDLMRGLDHADAVIHLAGEKVFDHRWNARHKAAMRESRVTTTRRLAELVAERERDALLTASAVCYYGPSQQQELGENSPPGDDFLSHLCRDWEEATAPAAEAGVRVASVRIGPVWGKGGGVLAKMLPSFRLGLGGPVGSGEQWVSWIHMDDLCSLFLELLENPELSGVFNGTAPRPVRMKELAETLGDVLGRPAKLALPAPVLRATLGDEAAEVLLQGQHVVPRRAEEIGFEFQYPTLRRALENLLC